tara:strand:+ start:1098 stop:1637 length:540 start_codon:yes stop_codon:yes gene_type:complete
MNVSIRQEQPSDYGRTEVVVQKAFLNAEHTDGDEFRLVGRLRKAEDFIPNLSLVAVREDEIVGHILFTPIFIEVPDKSLAKSLALAPVSVHPDFQGNKIGARLINEGHDAARRLGHRSVILLGHPGYYPRFGYKPASMWRIKPPFEVTDDAFMALELVPGALAGVEGTVKYPPAFGLSQ